MSYCAYMLRQHLHWESPESDFGCIFLGFWFLNIVIKSFSHVRDQFRAASFLTSLLLLRLEVPPIELCNNGEELTL